MILYRDEYNELVMSGGIVRHNNWYRIPTAKKLVRNTVRCKSLPHHKFISLFLFMHCLRFETFEELNKEISWDEARLKDTLIKLEDARIKLKMLRKNLKVMHKLIDTGKLSNY